MIQNISKTIALNYLEILANRIKPYLVQKTKMHSFDKLKSRFFFKDMNKPQIGLSPYLLSPIIKSYMNGRTCEITSDSGYLGYFRIPAQQAVAHCVKLKFWWQFCLHTKK